MLQGLHQVAQRSLDLDRSIAFYGDVLGLPLVGRYDPPGLAFFDLGGPRLLLEAGAPSSLLYFGVDDIDVACDRLRERGVEFVDEPHLVFDDASGQFGPPAEEWMVFFHDPDGNLLVLASRRSRSV
jgi:methylmalonyl-CoA/ethylmalonyl-CoA epimerase